MFSETMLDQMRYEIEHPEVMQKRVDREKEENEFIENTKKMFKAQGRDFEKEFEEWKEKNR